MQTLPASLSTAWFLFDNGSVRAESTRSLRSVAAALGKQTGLPIQAVSLLHSSNVPVGLLGGEPARLLEPALVGHFEKHPEGEAVLVPLFFGPSAALTDYVPARLNSLRARFPRSRVRLAPWLVHPAQGDRRLADALADQVKTAVHSHGLVRPNVVLVDHGSPQAAVAEVRDYLAGQLREVLGTAVQRVVAASMERREGDAYDFNDPLLARVLRMAPYDAGDLVVALQFLSPGRHAGPGGDIETICKEAQSERPQLRTYMTQPIGTDPRVLQLLVERLGQGLSP